MSIYENAPGSMAGFGDVTAVSNTPDRNFTAPLPCRTCGQPPMTASIPLPSFAAGGFVYAVGSVDARFPSPGVEQEYAQKAGVDPEAIVRLGDLRTRLADPDYRYLARELVWVFRTRFGDVCTIVPDDSGQLGELIELLPSSDDDIIQVLVGAPSTHHAVGPVAGLTAVRPVQLLSFTTVEFLDALPRPDDLPDKEIPTFQDTARSLFAHLVQRVDNVGLSDGDRARNYMATRYPALYHLTFAERRAGSDLVHIHTEDIVAGDRRTVAVQLVFRQAHTHVQERYHCQVDTTDVFPFVTKSFERTYD